MLLLASLGLSWLLAQHAQSAPTAHIDRHLFSPSLDVLDTVVLYDSPAFLSHSSRTWTVPMSAFVSLRQVDLEPATSHISNALSRDFGVNVGNRAAVLTDRIQMLSAIGVSRKELRVTVDECSNGIVKLSRTAGLPDLGHIQQNVALGACNTAKPHVGRVDIDSRTFTGTIFPSPPGGFGVISDIDDTIKVTNVLHKAKAMEATFLEPARPVQGMPEVYASLKKSLSDPQFMYVSGSPSQLYPFLHSFIGTTYPPGPILLQNVTITDISKVASLSSLDEIQAYKTAMIDRIHEWYPQKKFIVIGDSTQRDPETYGAAFRKYGGHFISCIWIRRVDGANNADVRFADAFAGIPQSKTRVYSDKDIPGLSGIHLAGGEC